MGKFVESKLGLLETHYCQRTQILVKFGKNVPPFKQSKQQKIEKATTVISLTLGE